MSAIATGTGIVTISVDGMQPLPQGSMAIHTNPQTGQQSLKHDQRDLLLWRKCVTFTARRVVRCLPHFEAGVPLIMGVVFRLLPPAYGRPGSRCGADYPVHRMDQDKLTRAVRDALTGVLYADDGQVLGSAWQMPSGRIVGFPDYKRYARAGELPGATICCARLVDLIASATAQQTYCAGPELAEPKGQRHGL